jgi:hypothetical protein
MSKHIVYASVIDAILDDVTPDPQDSTLTEGIHRGEDFRDISTDEADVEFLDALAGESDHTAVPGGGVTAAVRNQENWRGRSAGVADNNDSLLGTAMGRISGQKAGSDGIPTMSDAEVKAKITAALHLGISPAKIAAGLETVNRVFNKQFAHDFLESHAGGMGLSYLNPDHFGSCTKSHEFIKAKGGSIKAASVTRIAACGSCQKCSNGRCNLYKLPIVASVDEARKVIIAKFNTTKKAALKEIHNGGQQPPAEVVSTRSHANAVVRTAGDKMTVAERPESPVQGRIALLASKMDAGMDLQAAFEAVREEHGTPTANAALKAFQAAEKKATGPARIVHEERVFTRTAAHEVVSIRGTAKEAEVTTIQDVAKLITAGHNFSQAYSLVRGRIGSQQAGKVFGQFLADLKKTGGKVNLEQIDCTFLKGKLASSNAIVGAKKCAGCSYRCAGMHCGLTGGTLLSFPGMDRARSKQASYEGVQDGVQDMASYDMQADAMEIEFNDGPGDTLLGVEIPATSRVDVE